MEKPRVIILPKVGDRRGNLSVIEGLNQIPFEVKRVFWIYDVPEGEERGAHAHIHCHQFLVAISGSLEVVLDDGKNKRTIMLNEPSIGLHIPPGIWAHEQNFSSGSVCLVLASDGYDENDYIRDYTQFLTFRKG